jgi:hypothetical protein
MEIIDPHFGKLTVPPIIIKLDLIRLREKNEIGLLLEKTFNEKIGNSSDKFKEFHNEMSKMKLLDCKFVREQKIEDCEIEKKYYFADKLSANQ